MRLLRQFPAFVVLLMAGAALMLLPAIHAGQLGSGRWRAPSSTRRSSSCVVGVILGLATMNRPVRVPPRYFLLTLLLVYILLPLMLAAPLLSTVPGLGLGGAYFEMLSCLTTTGADPLRPAAGAAGAASTCGGRSSAGRAGSWSSCRASPSSRR